MKRKKFLKKTMALCLSALMSANIFCVSAFAEDAENTDQGLYVLMNIPYDDFYKAEIKNDVMVDNVTSATLQKTRNSGLAAGSFHVDSKGSDITGITYPVKVTSLSDLKNYKEVTNEDSVTITTTNRGTTSEKTYEGKDSLFESDKYSYYILDDENSPENYKELTFNNGNPVFSEIKGKNATEINDADVEISGSSRYGDYQVKVDLEGLPFTRDNTVYGVVVKTADGNGYGMRHLENIWRVSELAWCTGETTQVHGSPTSSEHYKSMVGKTITDIEYITDKGVYNIKANLKVTEKAYVLMNIPYDDFYKAEIKNDVKVDGVTSATLQKTRTGSLAAGSFHVDSKGSDITGITYPVKVTNVDYLKNFKEVTDEDSVTITTTNRGNTSEITYTGKDSLFESDKYSYYLLGNDSLPENYKELTFDNEGNPVFSKIKGKTTTEITNVNIEISNNSRYGDYQVKVDLEGLPFTRDNTVYGVVVKTADGNGYGMRHLENIWRVSELAWCTGETTQVHGSPTSSEHYKSMVGKTITDIQYITDAGVYNFKTSLEVANINTAVLETAIKNAESLNEKDYTVNSWSEMQTKLTEAKNQLSAPTSQSSVDEAAANLNLSINSLVKEIVMPTITGFKVSSTTSSTVKLAWDKVNNADGYIVYKYDNSKKTWVKVALPKTNAYTVSKLSSGSSYKFAVKAYKTVDRKEVASASYPQLSATTNPANVTRFKVSSTSANAVKLTWNKSSGTNGYVVYRYNTPTKKYSRIAKITSNTYTDKKLKSGTSYKYAVRAYKTVNGKELLSTSYPQIATSTNPATVSFKLTAGSKKATVKWSKVTGASGYKIYYKTSKNGKWIGLKTVNNKTTSYTKTKLASKKTYYFTVKAYRTTSGKTYNGAYTSRSIKIK